MLNINKLEKNINYNNQFNSIIGYSDKMQQVFKLMNKALDIKQPVLIIGETGTGKELVAKEIYKNSANFKDQFVAINCAAIPETLIESELFGYEKGAFTGADNIFYGAFEKAANGFLFLDEIAELPKSAQAKI